jgi:hypothetical protein
MRYVALILPTIITLFTFASIFLNIQEIGYPLHSPSPQSEPFAVVELFTSEGCSSCPPADKLLKELVSEAQENHQNIYGLGFHVSYWNQLGWKDKFSDESYTERQKKYAQTLPNTQVYTPQMIVNGINVFVGSNQKEAKKAIYQALSQKAEASIRLYGDLETASDLIQLKYDIQGAEAGLLLNVAIVEQELGSYVSKGENKGHLLHHENVVRSFKTIMLNGNGFGEVDLQLPEGIQLENVSIIAYLQHPDTFKILGATSLKMNV